MHTSSHTCLGPSIGPPEVHLGGSNHHLRITDSMLVLYDILKGVSPVDPYNGSTIMTYDGSIAIHGMPRTPFILHASALPRSDP